MMINKKIIIMHPNNIKACSSGYFLFQEAVQHFTRVVFYRMTINTPDQNANTLTIVQSVA
jgi:hypothetical protein